MLPATEIFKTGTHTPMQGGAIAFTAADLAAIAQGYDPAKWEAPVVVGHPATDAPAYAWVKALRVDDDRLVADFDQVDPKFAAMVKAGRFKNRSASFYRPDSPRNPTPGQWSLRHVGFLGAAAPAVDGLKPIAFAEAEDGTACISFSTEPENMDKTAEFAAREARIKADESAVAEGKKKLDADTASFAAQREQLEKDRAAFAAQQAATQRAADTAFLDGLVKAGTLPPAWRDGMVDFMARLDAAETVQFSAGDGAAKETERGFFERFLKALPAQIDFSARAGGDGAVDTRDPQALANAATAYQAEQAKAGRTVGTVEAMAAVTAKK